MDERIINVERGEDRLCSEIHADPWEQEDVVTRRFWRNTLLAVFALIFIVGFGIGKVLGQVIEPQQLALGETKNYAITACHNPAVVEYIIKTDVEHGVQVGAATFHRLVRTGMCFYGVLNGRFTEHISSEQMSEGRMTHVYRFQSGGLTLIAFSSVPPEELGI